MTGLETSRAPAGSGDGRSSLAERLLASIEAEGTRYDFFQTVLLLQHLHPDRPRVGFDGPPSKEIVRFRPVLGLSHQATDVASVRKLPNGQYEVSAGFLSIYGTQSPLPTAYTEDLIAEESESQATEDRSCLTREFLDLFNHRLHSLLYRAFEKYRFLAQVPGGGRTRGIGAIARRLRILAGLGDGDGRGEEDGDGARGDLLRFAGGLFARPAPAAMLQRALAAWFEGIGIRLETCVARWIDIPRSQRTLLGRGAVLGLAEGRESAVLGTRMEERATTFALHVGPVDRERFLGFLPGGRHARDLRRIVDRFDRDQLDYEVVVELAGDAPPETPLGDTSLRLGWCSWLGSESTPTDRRVRYLVDGRTLVHDADPAPTPAPGPEPIPAPN